LRKRIWLSSVLSFAVLTLVATALVAHASAPGATIKIAPNAALANPPNSVIVSVTYSCVPSNYTYGFVAVDQLQAAPVASGSRGDVFGFGNFQPVCDDRSHRADVVVSSAWWWNPGTFTTGRAGVNASVYSGVVYASTSAEVTIK
jgi:hypothetical protein